MTESQLQIQCVKWFRLQFSSLKLNLFHVPNGGKMSRGKGGKYKSEGVVSGIPDLLFLYNGELHAIEMKKPEGFTKTGNKSRAGTLQDSQKDVHKQWAKHHVNVFVCYSLESFQEFILNIVE